MKKLFATGVIYICLFVLLIAGVYNLARNLNDDTVQSDEVVATADDTKDSSENNEEEKQDGKPEEEISEIKGKAGEKDLEENPEDKGKQLEDKVVVKGDITENITPFNYSTTADKYLLDLCYAGIGNIKDRKCINEDMTNSYDKKRDITTYKIKINEDAENVSGDKITADDLIFNYYLRADVGYTGSGSIAGLPVVGLEEYRYGTRNIPSMKKKISKKLRKPDKRTAALIKKNIIRPVIEKEYKWVCSLYKQEMYDYITDKYPRKKDLFVYFFAYGTNYKTKGKTTKKVINDVIKSYGSNYNKLGKITSENYKKKAENIALYVIQSDKKFKFRVKNISGIKKIDDYTVEIKVEGKRKPGYINRLCDMYIVSMNSWANALLFDGVNKFGFKRGRADDILKNKSIKGDETGNYTVKEVTDGVYTLEKRV